MLTGNFPVQDAPPINFLTSGLLGASPASAGPSWLEDPVADDAADFLGLGSLSEFEKTMKLSSPAVVVAAEGFFAPPPPPGLPPFACAFFAIFEIYRRGIHVRTTDASQQAGSRGGLRLRRNASAVFGQGPG